MSNRELVIDLVNRLPEDAPLGDIIEQLRFVAGVQEGLDEANRGEGTPLEEVEKLIHEWTTPSS